MSRLHQLDEPGAETGRRTAIYDVMIEHQRVNCQQTSRREPGFPVAFGQVALLDLY